MISVRMELQGLLSVSSLYPIVEEDRVVSTNDQNEQLLLYY